MRTSNLRPAAAGSGSRTADQEKCDWSGFVSIYEETAWLVKAVHTYLFGEVYFRQLARELGPRLQLFVAVIAAERGPPS